MPRQAEVAVAAVFSSQNLGFSHETLFKGTGAAVVERGFVKLIG